MTDSPKPTLSVVAPAKPRKPGDPTSICDAWQYDPPVSDDHVVPDGFRCVTSPSVAILKVTINPQTGESKLITVSPDPILITEWIPNRTTGTKLARVAWRGIKKWHSQVVDRDALMDAGKIVAALARYGAPVNSGNRRYLVEWFAAYEHANRGTIPIRSVSGQMGWIDDGFLCGRDAIGCDVSFHPAEEGDRQLADAVTQAGTMSAWREAVAPVVDYPRVELAIYASLTAPMLRILDVPNFAIDWSYSTSTGKTTTLRVASSVWGCPDERRPASYILTWAATRNAIELIASTRAHLPLCLDDTKRAPYKALTSQVVYDITQGSGKARGTVGGRGTQASRNFRTVLLSTGESRIVDDSKDGGMATRILTLWGPPFGSDARNTLDVVRGINSGVTSAYGHAGRIFVRWLVEHPGEHDGLRARYAEIRDQIRAELGEDNAVSRMADYLAALGVTAELAHRILGLPWEYRSIVRRLGKSLVSAHGESDRAKEAIQHAYGWCASRRDQFWQHGSSRAPAQGWLGRWDRDDATCDRIYVYKHILTAELAAAGFDAGVVRLWRDRGWVEIDARGQRLTKNVRIDGIVSRVIAIRLDALREIEGANEKGNTLTHGVTENSESF